MKNRGLGLGVIVVVAIGLLAGVFFGGAYALGLTKADGGTVIVVRNGGMFDDNSFQQVILPNSSLTGTGLFSQNHEYPASQRYFKVSADEGADSNEIINVPTKDGVLVGVDGTFYFQISLDEKILKEFDDKFGTRTYPGPNGEQVHAWDEDGWSPFLSATLGNLVQNVLRQEFGQVKCAELVASCVLAQSQNATVVATDSANTLASIQDRVNEAFSEEVEKIMGVPIFTNIQFALSKVSLPDNVQNAINNTQSVTADANGRKSAAEADAQANKIRQDGYNSCPACQEQDILKALPQGLLSYSTNGEASGIVVNPPAPKPEG